MNYNSVPLLREVVGKGHIASTRAYKALESQEFHADMLNNAAEGKDKQKGGPQRACKIYTFIPTLFERLAAPPISCR